MEPRLIFDTRTLLTGMGPTYLWFQLYELKNIAGGLGLTDQAVDEGLAEMVTGAVKAIIGGRLSPAEVMDLIPVQPLSEFEEAITGMSREKLTALYE